MGNKLERKQMKIYASNPTKPTDIIAYGSDIVGPRVNTTDPDQIQTAQYEKGVRTAVVGKRSTSLQNRQTLDYLFSRALKYLFQMGVAEWLATEEYFSGSVVSDGEGSLFVSKTDNNIGNALSNTTHWDKFPTAKNLAEKVNKAGDTMTGDLKISGTKAIRFGTDDDFYNIKKEEETNNLLLFGKNNTGFFLDSAQSFAPSYWNGTNKFRLLTTADLPGNAGSVGFPNYNAVINLDSADGVKKQFIAPSDGWISYTLWERTNTTVIWSQIDTPGKGAVVWVNGNRISEVANWDAYVHYVTSHLFHPVKKGDIIDYFIVSAGFMYFYPMK